MTTETDEKTDGKTDEKTDEKTGGSAELADAILAALGEAKSEDDEKSEDNGKSEGDETEGDETEGLSDERRKELEAEQARHDRRSKEIRIALKHNIDIEEDKNTDVTTNGSGNDDLTLRVKRLAVKELLVDNKLPKEIAPIILGDVELDSNDEISNSKVLIKIASAFMKSVGAGGSQARQPASQGLGNAQAGKTSGARALAYLKGQSA